MSHPLSRPSRPPQPNRNRHQKQHQPTGLQPAGSRSGALQPLAKVLQHPARLLRLLKRGPRPHPRPPRVPAYGAGRFIADSSPPGRVRGRWGRRGRAHLLPPASPLASSYGPSAPSQDLPKRARCSAPPPPPPPLWTSRRRTRRGHHWRGAVAATDPASVDADHDNGIAAVPNQGGGRWQG